MHRQVTVRFKGWRGAKSEVQGTLGTTPAHTPHTKGGCHKLRSKRAQPGYSVQILLEVPGYVQCSDMTGTSSHVWTLYVSRDMGFPTMLYVRPAKPQISLRIRAV